jgi:hypothetical protein
LRAAICYDATSGLPLDITIAVLLPEGAIGFLCVLNRAKLKKCLVDSALNYVATLTMSQWKKENSQERLEEERQLQKESRFISAHQDKRLLLPRRERERERERERYEGQKLQKTTRDNLSN